MFLMVNLMHKSVFKAIKIFNSKSRFYDLFINFDHSIFERNYVQLYVLKKLKKIMKTKNTKFYLNKSDFKKILINFN